MRTNKKRLEQLYADMRKETQARHNCDVWAFIERTRQQLIESVEDLDTGCVQISPYMDNSWTLYWVSGYGYIREHKASILAEHCLDATYLEKLIRDRGPYENKQEAKRLLTGES